MIGPNRLNIRTPVRFPSSGRIAYLGEKLGLVDGPTFEDMPHVNFPQSQEGKRVGDGETFITSIGSTGPRPAFDGNFGESLQDDVVVIPVTRPRDQVRVA
jgi:hypothetical protein